MSESDEIYWLWFDGSPCAGGIVDGFYLAPVVSLQSGIKVNTTTGSGLMHEPWQLVGPTEGEDTQAPNAFDLNVSSTTNSITVTGETTDVGDAGIRGYQYKLMDNTGATLVDWTTVTTNTSYTFTTGTPESLTITQGETYKVSMRAVDYEGNITEATNKEQTIKVKTVADGETSIGITYDESTPTEGPVEITLSNNSGDSTLTIKYQIGSTEGEWLDYEGPISVETNKIIYARLVDGTGQFTNTATITIKNIDKLDPVTATVTASNVEAITFTLIATGEDAAETDDYSKSGIAKYEFYIDNTLVETVTTTANEVIYNATGKTAETIYKAKVRVYDVVGNYKDSDEIEVTTKKGLSIASVVQVGDFVNYDAGVWTQEDLNLIINSPSVTTYKYDGTFESDAANVEYTVYPTVNNSLSLPTTEGEFGGFTVGQSRNTNSTPSNGYGSPKYSGWRVFEIDEMNGIITLISAGHTESYYHERNGSVTEPILQKRDCTMYANEYAIKEGAYRPHFLTEDDELWWESRNDDVRNIGTLYSLASVFYDSQFGELFFPDTMQCIDEDGGDTEEYDNAVGLRVLVSLKPEVIVEQGAKHESGYKTWNIVGMEESSDGDGISVGDFVNYDAGVWSSSDESKITSSGGTVTWSSTVPGYGNGTNGQFCGFTIGQSRNTNSTSYRTLNPGIEGPYYSGWRVWEKDETTGIITLISAGHPETYYCSDDGESVSEEILQNRDCTMYANDYAINDGIYKPHFVTLDELNDFEQSSYFKESENYMGYPGPSTNSRVTLIDTGTPWCLATAYVYGGLYGIYELDQGGIDIRAYDNAGVGLRVLVSLKPEVILEKGADNETGFKTWNIVGLGDGSSSGGDQETTPPEVQPSIGIEYNPSVTTTENVKVTLTNNRGDDTLTLKYQIGTTTGEWTEYTEPIEMTENGIIYAKLFNSTGEDVVTAVATVTNIDKEKPAAFDLTARATVDTITITGSTTDVATAGCATANSGIRGYQFQLKDSSGNILKSWTPIKENGSYSFSKLNVSTTYKVSMKAIDLAGNEREVTNKDYSITTMDIEQIATMVKVGDFVNYDAGVWDMDTDLSKITSSGANDGSGSMGDASDGSFFDGAYYGESRNLSVSSCSEANDGFSSLYNGWRVWSIEDNVVTLVSACCPENFYGNLVNDNTILQNRDCSMYVNQYAASARILRKTDVDTWYNKNINSSVTNTVNVDFNVISPFLLKTILLGFNHDYILTPTGDDDIYCVVNNTAGTPKYSGTLGYGLHLNNADGIRILVTLNNDVMLRTDYGDGSVGNPWNIYGQQEKSTPWTGEVATGFAGGTGTGDDPYKIETAEQLAYLASSVNSGEISESYCYEFVNDIDLGGIKDSNGNWSGPEWTPIGTSDNPFIGSIDGNGHSISNIYIDNENEDFQGLIGVSASDSRYESAAHIIHLNISSGYIKGNNYVGGFIGKLYDERGKDSYLYIGSIESCVNKATIVGNTYVGGIAGTTSCSIYGMWSCLNSGSVTGVKDVGGICGYFDQSGFDIPISGCTNLGVINGTENVGGILGRDTSGTWRQGVANVGTVNGVPGSYDNEVGKEE